MSLQHLTCCAVYLHGQASSWQLTSCIWMHSFAAARDLATVVWRHRLTSTVANLFAEVYLFLRINTNSAHILYQYLSSKAIHCCNTRPRHHNCFLIEQTVDLNHCDFCVRILYTVSRNKRVLGIFNISLTNLNQFS